MMEVTSVFDLIIIGAGGHGKVVSEIAYCMGMRNVAFLDDGIVSQCNGFPVIGSLSDVMSYSSTPFFVAVGNADIRKVILDELISRNIGIATLVHPAAIIARDVIMGVGSVVMPGAVINPAVRMGCGCIVNTAASVDHDCEIGDFAHIAVGAHLCGTVRVGDKSWIGAGATISNDVSICGECTIGAGALVVHDIETPGVYIGVPAKKLKG